MVYLDAVVEKVDDEEQVGTVFFCPCLRYFAHVCKPGKANDAVRGAHCFEELPQFPSVARSRISGPSSLPRTKKILSKILLLEGTSKWKALYVLIATKIILSANNK